MPTTVTVAGESHTLHVVVVVPQAATPAHPQHSGPPGHLAFTGAPIDVLTAFAVAATVAGAAVVTATRRRARPRPTGAS